MSPRTAATLFCLLSLSCTHSHAQVPDQVTALIAKAEKSVKTVDMATLKSVINSKQAALIIDVREPEEYATGHLPGAINIPRGVIEFAIWKHVGSGKRQDGSKKVYLYCQSGPRAVLATKTVQDLGLKNVFAVVMDIGKWKAAGLPFTK